MSTDLHKQIDRIVTEFRKQVEVNLPDWLDAKTPSSFRDMELAVAATCRQLGDEITEVILCDIVTDPAFRVETSIAARQTKNYRHGGCRNVTIRLLGGNKIQLHNIEYLKPNHRHKRGRPRKKRGKGGSGLYPVLTALGICFGVTPALAGEVCRQVADSDSVRAGRAALHRRGIDLGHKQTLRLVNAMSTRTVHQRTDWLQEARQSALESGLLKGKRVVVSTDGGRLRERRYKRGRRRDNGHRKYDAPWREPKLFIIYVIDDKGDVLHKYRPIYDGTMGDCDAIFDMLVGYLRALGANEAEQLIVIGDGAKWIWERSEELINRIEIDAAKVVEVIDWYHAVETLYTISAIPSKWPNKEKKAWIRKAKKLLHAGHIGQLAEHIESLAVGRRAKKIRSHKDYFVRNCERMQYKSFVDNSIPIGSGAMESAIRRVINLRLKSNAKFWNEVNAEGMLVFRSYLKSGRFDDLIDWSISRNASWWLERNRIEQQHYKSPIL